MLAAAFYPCGGLLLVVLICSGGSFAYFVVTHEEIIDLLWATGRDILHIG